MKYLLNSAVITAPGQYQYIHITADQAREWMGGEMVLSTIRYQDTANAMSQVLGRRVDVNNVTITMRPGDEALVFRLVFPPGTARVEVEEKGRLNIDFILANCEIGLLIRIS